VNGFCKAIKIIMGSRQAMPQVGIVLVQRETENSWVELTVQGTHPASVFPIHE
jgi:hypothetical protein